MSQANCNSDPRFGSCIRDARHPVVSIHQPNFIPWMGYFNKIYLSDTFVFLDTAPYTKNGFQNRNRIRGTNGVQWLTVPVLTKGNFGAATREIKINDSVPWRRTHLQTLRHSYGKYPGFEITFEMLEEIYTREWAFLAEFNSNLILRICGFLGLERRFINASQLNETGSATQRIISLIKDVNGRSYLSGPSGRNYLEESNFKEEGIDLLFQAFAPTKYPMCTLPFSGELSMIDLLFCVGRDAIRWIRGEE